MASRTKNQALNRLLMTISDEIPPEKFERLVQLYDVQVPDVAKPYDTLKHLQKQGVLDLNELVKNLTTIKCLDQSEKVAEYIRETDTALMTPSLESTDAAPFFADPVCTPIPETGVTKEEEGQNRRPIQAVERKISENAAIFSPPPRKLSEDSELFQLQRGMSDPGRKKRRLDVPGGAEAVEYPQSDSPDKSEDEDEELDMPPVAAGNDLRFMKRALEVALQSEDPHTKVGAVLVSPENKIIGEGYNFLPREGLTWNSNKEDKEEDTKYPYVTHAAVVAIQAAYKQKESPEGATLYTNLLPSSRDGVSILTAGVKELVFLDIKREWRKRYHTGATKKLFDGIVQCRQVSMPE